MAAECPACGQFGKREGGGWLAAQIAERLCPADLVPQVHRVLAELGPGKPVPSVARIVGEYGVARTTAQKALRVRREEGLVRMLPGWGTCVTRRD